MLAGQNYVSIDVTRKPAISYRVMHWRETSAREIESDNCGGMVMILSSNPVLEAMRGRMKHAG